MVTQKITRWILVCEISQPSTLADGVNVHFKGNLLRGSLTPTHCKVKTRRGAGFKWEPRTVALSSVIAVRPTLVAYKDPSSTSAETFESINAASERAHHVATMAADIRARAPKTPNEGV